MGQKNARAKRLKTSVISSAPFEELLKNRNIQAYMLMIRKGEGTGGKNGYRMHYGGGLINTLNIRPKHEIYPGDPPSSAVGAYQFLNSDRRPYWDEEADGFGWNDILPRHQDIAALDRIDRVHGIQDILNGNIISAINKTKEIWASLPGANYNQPTQRLGDALLLYKNEGGSLDSNSLQVLTHLSAAGMLSKPKRKSSKFKNVPPLNSKQEVTTFTDGRVNTFKTNPFTKSSSNHGISNLSEINALLDLPQWISSGSNLKYELHGRSKRDENNNSNRERPYHKGPINNGGSKSIYPDDTNDEAIPLLPDQILRNIFIDYPNIRDKWTPSKAYDASDLSGHLLSTPFSEGISFVKPTITSQKYPIPGKGILPITQFEKTYLQAKNTNGIVGEVDRKVRNSPGDAGDLLSRNGQVMRSDGGYNELNRVVNVNINSPMIGEFMVRVTEAKDGIQELKQQVEEVLLEIINSANTI